VIYRPETERQSHCFTAQLPDQFDALLHFDETRAVKPLELTAEWEAGEVPETFPFAVSARKHQRGISMTEPIERTIEERLVRVAADRVTLEGNLSVLEGASGIVLFAHGASTGQRRRSWWQPNFPMWLGLSSHGADGRIWPGWPCAAFGPLRC
jgi:hypothetical protein